MESWALVTGGAGALGAAIVARLTGIRTPVVVLDVREPPKSGGEVVYHRVDLGDYEATAAISSQLLESMEPPRYVVSAAGLYERRSLFDYDSAATERMVRANLISLVYLLRFFLPSMLTTGRGRVVAISSQVGVTGGSDPLYAASKAGVTAVMKGAAKEYGRSGVTFTTVSCGPVDGTAMAEGMSRARREYYDASIPIGRFATVDEVVDLVVWLLKEGSPACNGSTFDLDGGITRR